MLVWQAQTAVGACAVAAGEQSRKDSCDGNGIGNGACRLVRRMIGAGMRLGVAATAAAVAITGGECAGWVGRVAGAVGWCDVMAMRYELRSNCHMCGETHGMRVGSFVATEW